MLLNPGLEGRVATTHTLFAGIQLILPGEVARTHRHTPGALRFIIEGKGAYTVVDGEKMTMAPGDFVLTPNWTWHDHGSESAGPVIWLDGLDLPLARMLEGGEDPLFVARRLVRMAVEDIGEADPLSLLVATAAKDAYDFLGSPLLKYAWTDARAALMHLGPEVASPFDGLRLEYVNPVTGGPSLPTMASFLQRLTPGLQTQAHRHSASAVYLAVEGQGRTTIEGKAYDWAPGDVFAVPTWSWHAHENLSASADAILFSFTDAPVMQALDLYREQAL